MPRKNAFKFIFWICLCSLFVLQGASFAHGTAAYTRLTNSARVFADNSSVTNWAGTNLVVAEIHGIMDRFNPDTNACISQGSSHDFNYSLTNMANLAEKRLILVLTNCLTNGTCGNWTIDVLSAGTAIFSTNSRGFGTGSAVKRIALTNRVDPGGTLDYGLRLTAATDAGANSSVSIRLVVQVTTNPAGYLSFDGAAYGGRTNIANAASASIAKPVIVLTKVIEKATNVLYPAGNPIMPGAEIWYLISFSNSGMSPGRNLRIIDFLPVTNTLFSAGTLAGSGFATNFSVEFRDRDGSLRNPSGWESNVGRVTFSATNTVKPGDKGFIRYRIRIK